MAADISLRLVEAVGSLRGVAAADRLCLACAGLLKVDAVAISLVFSGVNTGTFGASGPMARRYDEVQFTLGEGPCLDSVAYRKTVTIPELAVDRRWSAYPTVMLNHHIHGVFAIPLVVAGEYVGALDLFRGIPGALTAEQMAGAVLAAELAEMPFLDLLAQDLQTLGSDPDSDLWSELGVLTRSGVNQATGVLVAQLHVSPTEALVRLRAHAYATNRSASDVARDILDHRLRLDVDR